MKTSTKTFEVIKEDSKTQARLGILHTEHGDIHTPMFMPVGTQATVKTLSPKELEEAGAEIILSNTYHLYIRPGIDLIRSQGGLHKFMAWPKPILTDSGGYQVFSLARLREISDDGVVFNSHFDGRKIFLTPEDVIRAQEGLGSDIAMIFDECPPHDANFAQVETAVRRTIQWAKRAKEVKRCEKQLLFGIIQGGRFLDLRKSSLEQTLELNFDGYAIGGVSVGESREEMERVVRSLTPHMPSEKPRYLMGVGTPIDLFWSFEAGIDLLDCVNPTRYARNGVAFTRLGRLTVRNATYTHDQTPIDETCGCYTCRNFSRSYLRHLFNCEEILGHRLVSYHNIYFFLSLTAQIRKSILEDRFLEFKKEFLQPFFSIVIFLSFLYSVL